MEEIHTIPAGIFSEWLRDMRQALAKGCGIEVACGHCDACCRASLFIHISPSEKDVVCHIPRKLLFKAPGQPEGSLLMGYDAEGRCPMLTKKGCTIYPHRPFTCRTFDCRVFAATGITGGDANSARIFRRAARWRFAYPSKIDRAQHEAVQDAAAFLQNHAQVFPERFVPVNAAQLAVLAVRVSDVFINRGNMPDGHLIEAVVQFARRDLQK